MKRLESFLRVLARSRLAVFGAAVVTSSILADLILIGTEMVTPDDHPYVGIIAYLLLPGLVAFGLLAIPAGLYLRARRVGATMSLSGIEKAAEARRIVVPYVAQVVFGLTMLNLVIFGVIGYQGFHYTESVQFCGQLCHEVMHPEYTTYTHSPHSQIKCVECHIGPGAGWFVKSKLSGVRQVFAVLTNSYDRPIPTPVQNLRPAREVCEVCHRPELFHGNYVKTIQHFEADESNTRTFTVLNMRIGSGDVAGLHAHGIHWHVSKRHPVDHYASDRKREKIDWIRVTREDGTVRIWTRPGAPVKETDIAPGKLRRMDCVDCHNRPTHIYLSPQQALDQWLSDDRLDPSLPWIRKLGEEVLTGDYATTAAAMEGIARLPSLYRDRHPEVYAAREEDIRKSVGVLQGIFRRFVFPDMNIGWNTYNSLIGHPTPYTAACFRCHDGVLRDQTGEPITLDCTACHFVLADREADPRILKTLEKE